jgi:hypothetical protein
MNELPPKPDELTVAEFLNLSVEQNLRRHAQGLRAEGGHDDLAAALEEAATVIEEHGIVEGKTLLDAQLPDYEHWQDPAFTPRRFARGWVSYYDR